MKQGSSVDELEKRIEVLERKLNIRKSFQSSLNADVYNHDKVDLNYEANLPNMNFSFKSLLDKMSLKLPNMDSWVDYNPLRRILNKKQMKLPDINQLNNTPAFKIFELKDIKKTSLNIDTHITFNKLDFDNLLKSQSDLFSEILEVEKEELKKIANSYGHRKAKIKK